MEQARKQMPPKQQHFDHYPDVLSRIYEEDCNMACWQRTLPDALLHYADSLPPTLTIKQVLTPQQVADTLSHALPDAEGKALLIEDIQLLVDMFSYLFELDEVGLRLNVLERAMCPRFHVDHIPCRLATSWYGPATEWMDMPLHLITDRDNPPSYNQIAATDVALLKGDGWFNNSGGGIVHRSPAASADNRRLFMSLDFA